MREPPYIALLEIDEPFSKWCVLTQDAPTFGVTLSLIRVVVSLRAYGISLHFVWPHALCTLLQARERTRVCQAVESVRRAQHHSFWAQREFPHGRTCQCPRIQLMAAVP